VVLALLVRVSYALDCIQTPAIHWSPNLRYVAISDLKVGRSTIDERKVAIDTLRKHCIQSGVELEYDSPVSMVYVPLLGGRLVSALLLKFPLGRSLKEKGRVCWSQLQTRRDT
jgi:hypothetical protein